MYLVFDIGGTAIKYCYFDTNGKMFDKNEFLSTTLTNLNLFISRLSEIYFKSMPNPIIIASYCFITSFH